MSSTIVPGPTPTPHPGPDAVEGQQQVLGQQQDVHDPVEGGRAFELPKLRLNVLDLNHPGASRFLAATNASFILAKSVQTVLRLLYQQPSNCNVPGTRSVTLYLEDMGGVAYTKGSDLDEDHKEIRTLSFIKFTKYSALCRMRSWLTPLCRLLPPLHSPYQVGPGGLQGRRHRRLRDPRRSGP